MKEHDVDTTFMLLAHYRDIEVLDYDPNNGHLVLSKSRNIKEGRADYYLLLIKLTKKIKLYGIIYL